MITKIKNGNVTVEEYGLSPGTYPISALSINELLRERALLHIQYFEEMPDLKKRKLSDLIEQASQLIDRKCLVIEIKKAVLGDINKNLGKG